MVGNIFSGQKPGFQEHSPWRVVPHRSSVPLGGKTWFLGYKFRILFVTVCVLFSMLLVSCSSDGASLEPQSSPTAEGQDTAWNYVALGDSLLAEDWCNLPEQHAALIQADLGVEVNVVNLAVGGQSSEGLRRRVEKEHVRKAISEADIIVISIGGNDFGELVAPYFEGRCGGSDNQDCLREGLTGFQGNWDAILAEIVALANPTETLIRPLALGGVSLDISRQYGSSEGFDAFVSYAEAVRDYVVQSAAEYGIPVTDKGQLYDDEGSRYIGPDGVHPNAEGVAILVELLRDLGYEYGQ